jgi:hypothetical protein
MAVILSGRARSSLKNPGISSSSGSGAATRADGTNPPIDVPASRILNQCGLQGTPTTTLFAQMVAAPLTPVRHGEHPERVMALGRRLSVFVLGVALVALHAAPCAGWAATSDARMACCSRAGDCPMHASDAGGALTHHATPQDQVDACCAWSAPDQSRQSPSTVAPTISASVLGPASRLGEAVPALVLSEPWRTASPMRASAVRRHLLFSVFLV